MHAIIKRGHSLTCILVKYVELFCFIKQKFFLWNYNKYASFSQQSWSTVIKAVVYADKNNS